MRVLGYFSAPTRPPPAPPSFDLPAHHRGRGDARTKARGRGGRPYFGKGTACPINARWQVPTASNGFTGSRWGDQLALEEGELRQAHSPPTCGQQHHRRARGREEACSHLCTVGRLRNTASLPRLTQNRQRGDDSTRLEQCTLCRRRAGGHGGDWQAVPPVRPCAVLPSSGPCGRRPQPSKPFFSLRLTGFSGCSRLPVMLTAAAHRLTCLM